MVENWDDSICKPLKSILQSCLEIGKFPSEWEKANVDLIQKQGGMHILKNYRPISLLPYTAKFFERLLSNRMFDLFYRK